MLKSFAVSLAIVGAMACAAVLAQGASPQLGKGKTAAAPAKTGLSPDHRRMFCGDPEGDIGFDYAVAVSAEIDSIVGPRTGEAKAVRAALDAMRKRYCGGARGAAS